MKVAIIAAIGKNRVIGRDGKLPWHIPEDLKRFKRLTTGHAVLMGRRTYESIGKPLPDRRNVVLSSRVIPGIETHPSPEEALKALAEEQLVFVIGGAAVFSNLLSKAHHLFLTIVEGEYEGDTFFPEYEEMVGMEFSLVRSEQLKDCMFLDFMRIPQESSLNPV